MAQFTIEPFRQEQLESALVHTLAAGAVQGPETSTADKAVTLAKIVRSSLVSWSLAVGGNGGWT